MKLIRLIASVAIGLILVGLVQAQVPAPCGPPEIVFNKNVSNIFTEEQEVYLGEVIAETLDKNFVVLHDPTATAYLQQIGERLIKHLPPTSIKFKFFVVDAPELNAFSVAGGRIYVTRKLISFVKNEDELAGILGHELGHGIVRHAASDMSRVFKELLNVDKVGDRQDVYDKFNQMIDRQRTKRLKQKRGHEGDQQLEADRIGLFAMIAAGYDPNAYATAWERMTETKGKTGSSLGDFFGTTKPEEKRLREMLKAIGTIPQQCLERQAISTEERFTKWQSYVVSIGQIRYVEKLDGLAARGELKPSLRGSIQNFRFSQDGNYILAQDASGINVLKRDPFSFLFRLKIDDAKYANFTPDSKHFVIQTYGLRIEIWNIETMKAELTREVYVRDACIQTALSPDGKTLVCFTFQGNLDLIDVATSEKIFSKKSFYEPNIFDFVSWQSVLADGNAKEIDALEMQFSPDSKYFLGGRVVRFSMGGGFSALAVLDFGLDQEAYIAYDLQERKPIKLPGSLKVIVSAPFAFYSNDKIIGQHRTDPEKSGLFTFPGGERIEKFFLNANSYAKPHGGDYILVRPIKDNPVGVYSIAEKKFLLANKSPAMDGYGDYFVSENTDGIIDLVKLTNGKFESQGNVRLPRSELGDVRAIAISDDMNKLALSETVRGGVWDLKTGDIKVYVRGFRGAFVDPQGVVFADFPYSEGEQRTMGKLDPSNGSVTGADPITARGARQHGRYLIRTRTKAEEEYEKRQKEKGKDKLVAKTEEEKVAPNIIVTTTTLSFGGAPFSSFSFPDTTLEISDAVTRKPLWSTRFEFEPPKYYLDPQADTLTFHWDLTSKAAGEIIKKNPELSAKLKAMGEKAGDRLVQVVNAGTGAQLGMALIETGEGSFSIERVSADGDWLTILDSENRILFYSLSTGELKSRVFGHSATVNASRSIAAVENIRGILGIVDMTTGKRINELRFPSKVAYSSFNRQGDKLFVLTANQQFYIFNCDQFRRN